VKTETTERLRDTVFVAALAIAVIAASTAVGSLAAYFVGPSIHSRYFLWVSGRALGLAGYVALVVLVFAGVWQRHPWRLRYPVGHGEARLRIHASLAVATVALVMGHLVSLAADAYAGVGWRGAVLPGASNFRTVPVALGVIAWYSLIVFGASAGLAGHKGTKHWLAVHRFASVTFALVWLHATLSGTDSIRLRAFYVATGLVVVLVTASRYFVSKPSIDVRRFSGGAPRDVATPSRDGDDARNDQISGGRLS